MDPFAKIGVRARVCVNVWIVGMKITRGWNWNFGRNGR